MLTSSSTYIIVAACAGVVTKSWGTPVRLKFVVAPLLEELLVLPPEKLPGAVGEQPEVPELLQLLLPVLVTVE